MHWTSNKLYSFQIFQLYRSGGFYWLMKPGYTERTTDLPQVTDKLYQIICSEITALLVIGTDCTGSCKSNYHTTEIEMCD